jgi:diketogulonate reductase-like aldo/keto reductase
MTQYPTLTLNNGVTIPQLGLGVWQAKDGEEVESAVRAALKCGYRLIDTAAVYGNEQGVGKAIAESGIPREELFITTKVWNADQGYENTLQAFDASLERLGLDYVDLYLIHWPVPAKDQYVDTWKALEQIYKDGRAKSIGVSNFKPHHLDKLLESAEIIPAVNQIELHPNLPQQETREACDKHGIIVESYSPLGGSNSHLFDNQTLIDIGAKYDKTPAQVILRWHIQNNFVVIPKSVHAERIEQNFDIFDFELEDNDMAAIATLDNGKRYGSDPDTANFT